MKNILLLFLMFVSTAIFSQSAYTIVNSQGPKAETKASSMANPWVGAKLAYNLNEDVPVDESFLLSAKLLYIPFSGTNYAVPVVSTVGLQSSDITNPDAGFNVGLYPWYRVHSASNFAVVLHGGVGYKAITADVPDALGTPQQIKLLAGAEVAFMPSEDSSPITLSLTPAFLYNTNTEVPNTGSLEATGVVPIAKGLGLLVEGVFPFKSEYSSSLRFGVIVNGKI